MLKRFWSRKKESVLDEPIAAILSDMNATDPDKQEYSKMVGQLERLIRLKQEESKSGVSPDAVLLVIGNLVGILIIVTYEHNHVLVSKAVNFILRPRENRQQLT